MSCLIAHEYLLDMILILCRITDLRGPNVIFEMQGHAYVGVQRLRDIYFPLYCSDDVVAKLVGMGDPSDPYYVLSVPVTRLKYLRQNWWMRSDLVEFSIRYEIHVMSP